jgi:tRNA A-37 threonylcarbamoyl transferase component Bud32/CheY-like chemotaxis protein
MARIGLLIGDGQARTAYARSLKERGHQIVPWRIHLEPHQVLEDSPDLLVLDSNPTNLGDLELLAQLRRTVSSETLPIILLSVDTEEKFRRGFAAGANDCLDRGVQEPVLLAKITHLLQPSSQAATFELPWPGQVVLDRYRVDQVLGKGAYGAVFRATDLKLDRSLAFKVLLRCEGSELRARFMREAYTLGAIDCPQVARVFDFGELPQFLYIIMELVEGPTLQSLIRIDGPCGPAKLASLARGMALALAACHEAGFHHRDVKPANFVLRGGRYNSPVLIDFGLAKSPIDSAVTSPDMIMGSPGYIAPELLARDGDERSDLYALGQCLVYAARGQEWLPMLGGIDLLKAAAERSVPVPHDLPEELRRILLKLTAIDPAERHASARELLADLQRFRLTKADRPPARTPPANASPSDETQRSFRNPNQRKP